MTAARPAVEAGRRRVASAVLAAALTGAAAVPAVMLAPVAAAHAVLVSVDPEDGADLPESPERVTLTFNEDINQSFATVAVTSGGDTTSRVVGDPAVDGSTVTVEVDDLAGGAYTIGYRVTSADGHVISGSSVFTVAGGADAEAGDGAGAASDAGPDSDSTTGSSAGDAADAAAETSGEDTGVNPAIWVVGGLAVLLLGGAFFLLRRGN